MMAGTNVDAGGWPVLAVLVVMFEIPDVSEEFMVALPAP
jgi:hypothetical protein